MIKYLQMVEDLGLDEENFDSSDVPAEKQEKLDQLITYVNTNNLGWSANQCLHSKSKCGNSLVQKH